MHKLRWFTTSLLDQMALRSIVIRVQIVYEIV
eukprot:SAG11_NODE_8495_length_1009_cov_1.289011_2_plen_31_part_01